MSFLNIFKTMVDKRMNKATGVVKTTTPLGMHQGSMILLPEVDLAVAQVDGSIIQAPKGQQIVTAVGVSSLFGKQVYNVYLSNSMNFIQLVTNVNSMDVLEAKFWSHRDEIVPASVQDWEFWLGTWNRDVNGNVVHNRWGQTTRAEYGLIGFPKFQVDTTPPLVYNRLWNPSDGGIDPVEFSETITFSDGFSATVEHQACEYWRNLTNSSDSTQEYLLASTAEADNEAGVEIFVGIKLEPNTINVIKV